MVIDTMLIALVNFVDWLIEVESNPTIYILSLCCWSDAIHAGKSVFPLHTCIHLLIQYILLMIISYFLSPPKMNTTLIFYVDHKPCLDANNTKTVKFRHAYFCGDICQEVRSTSCFWILIVVCKFVRVHDAKIFWHIYEVDFY